MNSTENFQKAAAGFRRMDEVLRTAPDIQDKPGARPLEVREGAIEYRDVCFSYPDTEVGEGGTASERPVIDHMNLSIRPGETTAPLFTCVTFDAGMGNEYQDATATVHVAAEAVQTANNGVTALEALGWPTQG